MSNSLSFVYNKLETMVISRLKRCFFYLFLLPCSAGLFMSMPVEAQSSSTNAQSPCIQDEVSSSQISQSKVCNFFESRMNNLLEKYHIPGATVSVTEHDKIIFSGGYGKADVEKKTQFTDKSLVRVASISKLFTYTAVMQLVEQGKIKLDDNVNDYLKDFKIPEKYSKPITINNFMDHTSGFEDSYIEIGSRTASDVPELRKFLATHIPERIYEPGQVASYSNYDAALAGYIVSLVSGIPYPEYIQKSIFEPLQMYNSTAFEPVPAAIAENLSKSYEFDRNQYKTVPFIFDNLAPDGSISTSSSDIAHFMIAQLNNGKFGNQRILQPETLQQMHTRSFTLNKNIAGWAHGFKEQNINGYPVLMHDGGWESYVSVLILVPDKQLGLFVSFNSDGGAEALGELMPAFAEEFLSKDSVPALRPETPKPEEKDYSYGKKVEGFYRNVRSPITTIEKINSIIGPRVVAHKDGSITFQNSQWVMIESFVYQKAGSTERLAFIVDKSGNVKFLGTDRSSFIRYSALESPITSIILAGIFFLTTLVVIVCWPILGVIRRIRDLQSQYSSTRKHFQNAIIVSVLLGVLLIGGVVYSLVTGASLLYGIPLSIKILLFIPLLMLGSTVYTGYQLIKLWGKNDEKLPTKFWYTFLFSGILGLLVFVYIWNLNFLAL